MNCPLCRSEASSPFLRASLDAYHSCAECGLVFLASRAHLSPRAERNRYLEHHNTPWDRGYREHLKSAIDPLVEQLQSRARSSSQAFRGECLGLDFGCGPEPVAQLLLKELGYECKSYDPFFAPHTEVLERRYEFVLCIEVVEHLREPGPTWQLLYQLLLPGGILAVRTELLDPALDFQSWWYRQDATHIAFYREATMQWIENRYDWKMTRPHEAVRIFVRDDES